MTSPTKAKCAVVHVLMYCISAEEEQEPEKEPQPDPAEEAAARARMAKEAAEAAEAARIAEQQLSRKVRSKAVYFCRF